mmetsp:Transcript_14555/g.41513  ORF Transcript_14555/g.41513 Transcript_14555/m.41513 type:complete len:280 (-) Transcript_14555:1205-2044(-)
MGGSCIIIFFPVYYKSVKGKKFHQFSIRFMRKVRRDRLLVSFWIFFFLGAIGVFFFWVSTCTWLAGVLTSSWTCLRAFFAAAGVPRRCRAPLGDDLDTLDFFFFLLFFLSLLLLLFLAPFFLARTTLSVVAPSLPFHSATRSTHSSLSSLAWASNSCLRSAVISFQSLPSSFATTVTLEAMEGFSFTSLALSSAANRKYALGGRFGLDNLPLVMSFVADDPTIFFFLVFATPPCFHSALSAHSSRTVEGPRGRLTRWFGLLYVVTRIFVVPANSVVGRR